MNCPNCGNAVLQGAAFCGNCGATLNTASQNPPAPVQNSVPASNGGTLTQIAASPAPQNPVPQQVSNKSYLTTFLLAAFLGGLGVDRYYLGEIGTGLLKMITLGGFGIWSLYDVITTLAGSRKDKEGRELKDQKKYQKICLIIFIVMLIGFFITGFYSGLSDENKKKSQTSSSSQSTETTAPDTASSSKPANSTTSTGVPIGKLVVVKDQEGHPFEVTLIKYVETAKGADQYISPDSGKRFTAVQLKLTNKSAQISHEVPENNTFLMDSGNQSYPADYNKVADCQAFAIGLSLNPQESAIGCVVFQVPKDAVIKTVKFVPSSGYSDSSAAWAL